MHHLHHERDASQAAFFHLDLCCRVWNEKFGNVKIPKYVSFAACDVCCELKARMNMASHPDAYARHKQGLDLHHEKMTLDRRVYDSARCKQGLALHLENVTLDSRKYVSARAAMSRPMVNL